MQIKLLIALIVLVLGGGGYYAYGQYQQKQEVSKSEDLRSKILNAPATPKGVF
jgi:hypothetical protein